MSHRKLVPVPVWVADVLIYALGLKNMDTLDTPAIRSVLFGNEELGCILNVLAHPETEGILDVSVVPELDSTNEGE